MSPEEKQGMKVVRREVRDLSGRQWKRLRKTLQREDAAWRREQAANPPKEAA